MKDPLITDKQLVIQTFLKKHYNAATKKGEMAEWSNAHAWKACKVSKPSRVRIPLSPPPFKYLSVSTDLFSKEWKW